MRLCIPVCSPDGLRSIIEPHLPAAEHILFFDTESRTFEHVALNEESPASRHDVRMDAVLCGSINRITLRSLLEQGIEVYGTAATTAADAVAQFERGELVAAEMPSGGCSGHAHGGGCCSGHGHAHESTGCSGSQGCHGGGGCHGHGEQAEQGCHGHHAGGGCCSDHQHAPEASRPKARNAVRRIAVTSQNRKAVTEHAGKCRKFWVYEIADGQIASKSLLELPLEQSFHAASPDATHPLDDIDVLISAGMGDGLRQRLGQRGILGVVTQETDPDRAVADFLSR